MQERPCVIIQCDMVNRRSQTVIVAPLLPGHMTWPFVVNIRPSTGNGLDKERHVNVKQSRAVDISRIDKRQGLLEKRYLDPLKEGCGLCLILNGEGYLRVFLQNACDWVARCSRVRLS